MSAAQRLPEVGRLVIVPPERRPALIVLVDAEEEFDWNGRFERHATSVESMAFVERLQRVLDVFDVVPVYVADHPVVSQAHGYEPLVDIHRDGRCVIGSHLHPWVNPPYDGGPVAADSFPGNLPRDVERAKLSHLTDTIAERFGEAPRVYQAGRYGLGPNTAGILEELGYEVDMSACPPFDYSSEGGPDYSRCPLEPYWFGRHRKLLGLPCTGAYLGASGSVAHRLHRAAQTPLLRALHVPGMLARAGIAERLRLSPEGFGMRDLRRLTHALLARGLRVFTYSLHTPSLMPGCTPYVHSEADAARLLDDVRSYLEFFFGELDGRSVTPLDLKAELEDPAAVDVG